MANAPALEIEGLEIHAPITDAYAEILTFDALTFIATLIREFRDRRNERDLRSLVDSQLGLQR